MSERCATALLLLLDRAPTGRPTLAQANRPGFSDPSRWAVSPEGGEIPVSHGCGRAGGLYHAPSGLAHSNACTSPPRPLAWALLERPFGAVRMPTASVQQKIWVRIGPWGKTRIFISAASSGTLLRGQNQNKKKRTALSLGERVSVSRRTGEGSLACKGERKNLENSTLSPHWRGLLTHTKLSKSQRAFSITHRSADPLQGRRFG